MSVAFALLALCFALSGAAGLVFETAWSQQFGLVFGASELAVVCVLAAYMTGLAGGAWWAARLLSRVRRPLLAYSAIEALVALSALGVPGAIGAAGRLQEAWLSGPGLGGAAGPGASTLFQFVSSFAILLVPTSLMGATLPLLARQAVRGERRAGARIALLYAANTLGAAAGVLGCAFLLLPRLGLARAALVGVALDLAAAGMAFVLGLRAPAEARSPALAPSPSLPHTWPLWVAAGSGAIALGTEILWTRLLTHVLGSSVYAFGSMLAAFLVGIAIGSAAAASQGRTREQAQRALALAQLGAGLAIVVGFVALDALPAETARLARATGSPLASTAAVCAALLVPGALCFGASFPLTVRLMSADPSGAASASGRALAWNTLGAVAGATGVGMWLLPWLRFEGTARAAAAASLALAALAALGERPRRPIVALTAAGGLATLAMVPLPAPWNVLRTSPFVLLAAHPAGPESDEPLRHGPIAYYGVGRSATVLLHDEGAEWRLTGNGLPESAIQAPGGRPARYTIARLLALLPHAVRSEVRRVMVVGLGGGHSVEDLPSAVESADVVELEPEVVAANRFLAGSRRRDPLADPRVRIHLGDARTALALGRERFDAIVSQPSHPWTAGSSHLFTREFFARAAARLRPGGVFVQWIGLDFVDAELFRSLLATLRAAFAEVEVYGPHPVGAALFVASDRPLDLARQAGRAVGADPGVWRALGCFTAEDVLALRLLDAAGVKRLAEGAVVNTDGRNLLQTRSPLVLGAPLRRRGLERLVAAEDAARRLPAGADGLYLVRRFIEQGATERALRTTGALRDPRERETALTLVDLAAGRRAAAEAALVGRVASSSTDAAHPGSRAESEDRAALLAQARAALVAGRAPRLLPWIVREPAAAAVLEGWRRSAGGDAAGVRGLEEQLAAVEPIHPLFRPASRLRIAWRATSNDPRLSREALELLDALVAGGPSGPDLLLRARLAARAGDAGAALTSLDELVRGAPGAVSRAGAEALAILSTLPAGVRPELRAQLAAAFGGSARR